MASALQKMAGGGLQAALFGLAYRGRCAAEALGGPVTHLDEDQGLAVAHHQIDLPVPAAVIACHQPQALGLEIGPRQALLGGARVARGLRG